MLRYIPFCESEGRKVRAREMGASDRAKRAVGSSGGVCSVRVVAKTIKSFARPPPAVIPYVYATWYLLWQCSSLFGPTISPYMLIVYFV